MEITDPRMPRVVELCKEKGIAVTASWFSQPEPEHALTVEITLTGKQHTRRILGVSVGGGSIRVDRIDNFEVKLSSVENYIFAFGKQEDTDKIRAIAQSEVQFSIAGAECLFYWTAKNDNDLPAVTKITEQALYVSAFMPLGYQPHTPLFTTFRELVALSETTGRDAADLAIDYEINRSGRMYFFSTSIFKNTVLPPSC